MRPKRDPPDFAAQRERMVDVLSASRGIRAENLLAAMRRVPREEFVSARLALQAYDDRPLPIGKGQTISQPSMVALMIEALGLEGGEKVLDVGTGSGYAAAIIAHIAAEVYTIERLRSLAAEARDRFERLHYANIRLTRGDGSLGWKDHAPYDAIVVGAGAPDTPPTLRGQLVIGGRLVMPVGASVHSQRLIRETRVDEDRYERESLCDVRFVPLVGAEGCSEEGPA